MAKISISLPDDVLEYVREHAEGNVSAFVTDVIRREFQHADMRALAAELVALHGPVDEVALADLEAVLDRALAAGALPQQHDLAS